MVGDDVLFGEGQDDNIYGGTGNDRIYGGTGIDGILGDDGVMLTSRNGLTEPLNRLFTPNLAVHRRSSPARSPRPTSSSPASSSRWRSSSCRSPTRAARLPLTGGNDVIYGGLGDDFIHGESGDDAISGAEALREFYNENPVVDTNPLHYDGDPTSPNFTKFPAYDADDPWSIIPNWFLNFDPYVVDEATGQPIDSNGAARQVRRRPRPALRRPRQRLDRRRHELRLAVRRLRRRLPAARRQPR